MKILILVNEFPPDTVAGTAMATASLSRHLVRIGHRVRVVVTERKKSPGKEFWQGVEIRRLSMRGPKGTGWLIRLCFILKESIRFKPQILQGQSVSCGLLVAITGRLLGIPSITYAQGQDVYQAKPWQLMTEIRYGCCLPTIVAAVTARLASQIGDLYGRRDIMVLPHGLEVSLDLQFQKMLREKRDRIEKGLVVLSVGRLEYIKGQDILLAAWPTVLADFSGAQLWIAGDGDRREALERQAEIAGISHSVHFWGHLTQQRVAAMMSVADLFVLPSRSEAFGIVLLEAMAEGLPVVATDVGGVSEVIPPSGDAKLIPPGDALALGDSIVRKLRYLKGPSDVNRAWAHKFTWDKLVYRFERLYKNLIK